MLFFITAEYIGWRMREKAFQNEASQKAVSGNVFGQSAAYAGTSEGKAAAFPVKSKIEILVEEPGKGMLVLRIAGDPSAKEASE